MTHQLHFDLSHVDTSGGTPLHLLIRGEKYPLSLHTAATLEAAAATNQAVSVLLAQRPSALSHYVDAPHHHFIKNRLTRIQVVGECEPSAPAYHLPPLYHVAYMTHLDDYKTYFARLQRKTGLVKPALFHAFGLAETNDDPWQILMQEYHLQGPVDVAKFLAGQHPLLASSQPQTHLALQNEHIYPTTKTDPDSIQQLNNIQFLAQSVKSQGQPGPNSGFAIVKQSVDGNGNPLTYQFPIGDPNNPTIPTGTPVMIYSLTDTTNGAMAPAIGLPLQTSRNDQQFQNQTWGVNQGTASYDVANQTTTAQSRRLIANASPAASAPGQWSVSPNTSSHGITVDQNSIQFKGTNFSVDAYNNFLRIVGAYVEFFADADMTQAINNPMSPHMLQAFQTDTKTYLDMISSVNTILGIPFPTDPTQLQMAWPDQAQAAKLMFGGVGTWNYDAHVVWPGFIETGIFCFGIPIFMMAAQAAVTDTQWYKEFVKDTDNIMAAVGVGFSVGGAAFGVDAGFIQGLKTSLYTFGDIIVGILAAKGMEKLSEYLLAKIVASEFAEAAPFVGWALRAVSVAIDVAELAVSFGEVMSSPAVIEIDVKRQMAFTFTLHPDPAHGEAGNPKTAIWPAVADHYRILVNYKTGSGFESKGQVPLTPTGGSSNQPIQTNFTVPWGGQMQIIAAVYSANGWLCGKYQSDWLPAVPDASTPGAKAVDGNITEILVPLTQDTQYTFKQKLTYNSTTGHTWQGVSGGATVPTDTVSSLNSDNTGNNIAQLAGITINETATVIGYTWQASGVNIPLENGTQPDSGQMFVFQNVSVLSDAESRLKFPPFGFKTKPGLAYDVYGGSPTQVGPLNFVIDTRNASTGYLRLVDLMDGNPQFDLNSGMSYGTFSLGDIDALAVHPNGYVVAVNWASHKMQLLKLADQAVPDANAPLATVVSGKGILQGLMQGPIALAISPDGKIYVLESLNNRVQAFDINGNPAPSFTGQSLFSLPNAGSIAQQLDQRTASSELVTAFLANGASDLFSIAASLAPTLDSGTMTMDVISAFAANMVYLAYLTDDKGNIQPDPTQTSFITVIKAGQEWTITDPSRNYVYTLTATNGAILVQDQFSELEVVILQQGVSWQLKDLAGGDSFLLTLNGTTLNVAQYLSYFSVNPKNESLTYCDLAIESKGYVYVLAYQTNVPGTAVLNTAYVLDVYTPQGEHLFRTPDSSLTPAAQMQYIAAGKMAIDLWRDVFTLNYEKMAGPQGRTEPTISQWIPTPPLFDIALTDANVAMFDQAQMAGITAAFATANITLSSAATCTVVQAGQQWQVIDTNQKFNVVTTIGQIEVYSALV
ncbi:hypothetical protein ACAW74_27205 [Fibrella sp. WM1]|uniref:hypothetical protein n=1 Tax=Fibrella musci TaxID=3242485 RepID=UPI00352106CE